MHLEMLIFIKEWLKHITWHIGEIENMINNKLQKISFEKENYEKDDFLVKGPQKDNSL